MKYTALLKLVAPNPKTLILILALLLAGTAISLANPWIAGLLTETLLTGPGEGRPTLRTILLAWLGLVALKSLLSFSSQYFISITGERVLAGLRSRLYDHLQILPLRYFHESSPGDALANVYGQVQRTLGAADRLQAFFAENAEPNGSNQPISPLTKGAIEFESISFAYPDRESILRDFNLKIEAGETIAITGPNGAGKSTLAYLLMRFDKPQSGRILIDDHDIEQFDLQSVREQIGLVAQNTLLVNGTVRDNLVYGRFNASEEDIERAANAARASEFIEQLPEGYNTIIGDQGVKLSGGERTVILITHRPASLALADRVLKMDAGKIVITE